MTTLTLRLSRPHPGQRRCLREARRFNVADCGRRFGKTLLGEERAADAAIRGQPVGWFSPTYRMLSEVWRDLTRTLRPIARQIHVQERRIELLTGGTIEFWSLDTPDVARGRKYARVIIDEAAMVPVLEEAWQAVIRPTLTDLVGDAWFLSTPRGFNFFHALYRRGQDGEHPEWASWQMPTTANPYIPPEEVESARREVPDRVFRQEYLALFEDDASTIFSPTWWTEGRNRYDGEPWPLLHTFGRFLSLDTAYKEHAGAAFSTVLTGELEIFPRYRLALRDVWRDRVPYPDLVAAAERAIEAADCDGRLAAVLVEDRASGVSLVQTLKAVLPAHQAAKVVAFEPKGDKAHRASLASVWCRNGRVLLPSAAPWLREFEAELYAAPFGPFMDQVDAFTQMILWNEPYIAAGDRQGGEVAA